MTNVACEAVARNVTRPLKFCGIGVAGADVACLELFKLLLCAEFVGLCEYQPSVLKKHK
jgi:hypothetical protein